MLRPANRTWLNRFAVLTALATLVLIGIGGLVTSKGVGMAVPDWPTTYGYNMFLFPVSKWVGGIFYEHTHRLMASVVGTLVVVLMRWLGGSPSRKALAIIGATEILVGLVLPHIDPKLSGAGYMLWGVGIVVLVAALVWIRNEPAGKPLRVLGWFAFFAVQLQGLLGGLRVILYWDAMGIFHAALAQTFFVLLCAIVLLTSAWWENIQARISQKSDRLRLRPMLLGLTLLIFGQLILGATMRHAHAGLAIPDFPLAYHKLWPATDAASVASYNDARHEVNETNPITAFQIVLQMVHRMMAVAIFCAVAAGVLLARRLGGGHPLALGLQFMLGLIFCQVILGAATIWSNKAADVATLHVVVGALSLVTSALLTIVAFRVLIPARAAVPAAAAFAPPKPAVSASGH